MHLTYLLRIGLWIRRQLYTCVMMYIWHNIECPCMSTCIWVTVVQDCILGNWSDWSDCDVRCGPGVKQRSRDIIYSPVNGGRPCGALVEKTVCEGTGCKLPRASDSQEALKGINYGDVSPMIHWHLTWFLFVFVVYRWRFYISVVCQQAIVICKASLPPSCMLPSMHCERATSMSVIQLHSNRRGDNKPRIKFPYLHIR